MKIFSRLYNKVNKWSKHPHAGYYLAGVSFAESSFFPIPPDVMLISMGLAKPSQSWRYARIVTISSVLGGVFGYLLGAFFLHLIFPYIESFGYLSQYQMVQNWFQHWGIWVILLAGFSPVPYKLFTISAGAAMMPFMPFVLTSLIARALRFYLVAGAIYLGGERIEAYIHRYADLLGWSFCAVLIIVYILY